MTPGDHVRLEITKWGGTPHWRMTGTYLGTDPLGDWIGFPTGTHMSRPGLELVSPNPQVGLVPAPSEGPAGEAHRGWLATFHGPGGNVRTYVDMTTPPVWDTTTVQPTLRCVDLDLDVIERLDGEVFLDDEDEFAEHQVSYGYPPDVIALAEGTSVAVQSAMRSREAPYDGSAAPWLALLVASGPSAASVLAALVSMGASTGQSWADYREDVFGPAFEVWHDGAAFEEIRRRYATDPEAVTRQLLAGIDEGDALAATAVRELRLDHDDTVAWVARLEDRLPASSGSTQVEIGATLHALTGEGDATPLLAVLADRSLHWGVRLDAARRLAGFAPTVELVRAAGDGVRDPDYLVRYHSANTLLVWAGAKYTDLSDYPDLFPQVAADERPDLWDAASTRLAGFVALPGPSDSNDQ